MDGIFQRQSNSYKENNSSNIKFRTQYFDQAKVFKNISSENEIINGNCLKSCKSSEKYQNISKKLDCLQRSIEKESKKLTRKTSNSSNFKAKQFINVNKEIQFSVFQMNLIQKLSKPLHDKILKMIKENNILRQNQIVFKQQLQCFQSLNKQLRRMKSQKQNMQLMYNQQIIKYKTLNIKFLTIKEENQILKKKVRDPNQFNCKIIAQKEKKLLFKEQILMQKIEAKEKLLKIREQSLQNRAQIIQQSLQKLRIDNSQSQKLLVLKNSLIEYRKILDQESNQIQQLRQQLQSNIIVNE